MSEDLLYRGLHADAAVRFVYTVCTGAVNEAVVRHGCDPLSAHLLSRSLGAGILTAPLLNGDERYTLRWQYDGAVKTVLVDVDSRGRVRGFISPQNLMQEVDSEAQVYGENGLVSVVKATPQRQLNAGTIAAGLLDVVDDLAIFFSISDQIETAITVMVGFRPDTTAPVSLCQGLLLQALPGCDLERFERLRQRLSASACRGLLASYPDSDNHFELILRALCGEEEDPAGFSLHAAAAPAFVCHCSRERMLEVVRTLPCEEREAALQRDGVLRVTCQFCSAVHELSAAEIGSAAKASGTLPER